MTIPDFQTVMLPLLRAFGDGASHKVRELVDPLADEFDLTPEERSVLIPSGRQGLFRNRLAWATTHITKAGLLERVGHGEYRITERGRTALQEQVHRIDMAYLRKFEDYREFRRKKPTTKASDTTNSDAVQSESTPQELLETSYYELRATIAQELLDEAKSVSPARFERIVIDLLVSMGYGGSQADAAQAVGRSGDGGIDGIIKEDRLGLDAVYVQAKRWENVVGRPVVQGFAGSLEGQRARKGVMITTSTFSPSAHEYVGMIEKKIVLIDGEQLAELMIDHGIGVSEVQTYTIYRVDSDYFSDE